MGGDSGFTIYFKDKKLRDKAYEIVKKRCIENSHMLTIDPMYISKYDEGTDDWEIMRCYTLKYYISYKSFRGKTVDVIYNMFKEVCMELDPFYGRLMHYDASMLLVVNTDKFNGKTDFQSAIGYLAIYSSEPFYFVVSTENEEDDYVYDKKVLKMVSEAKKFMTREELIEIMKKHSYDVFENGKGVGCFPAKLGKFGEYRYAYPRYFIREELRKRGMKIPYELPEEAYFIIKSNKK